MASLTWQQVTHLVHEDLSTGQLVIATGKVEACPPLSILLIHCSSLVQQLLQDGHIACRQVPEQSALWCRQNSPAAGLSSTRRHLCRLPTQHSTDKTRPWQWVLTLQGRQENPAAEVVCVQRAMAACLLPKPMAC